MPEEIQAYLDDICLSSTTWTYQEGQFSLAIWVREMCSVRIQLPSTQDYSLKQVSAAFQLWDILSMLVTLHMDMEMHVDTYKFWIWDLP